MTEKIKQLRVMTLATGCVVIMLSAFLCGCDSQKEGERKGDSVTSRPSLQDTYAPVAGGCTFSSGLHLEVFVMYKAGGGWRRIGVTPSDRPLNIPRCALWAVKPAEMVAMDALAREIATKKIPGLWLGHWATIDADLVDLKGLTELQTLCLYETYITDAGLAYLKGLTGLQELDLSHTKITDAGLSHLKGMTGLQTLNLSHTKITGAGLSHLKGMTGLQELNLWDSKITDAGLIHLKGLTGLQMLCLAVTDITDAGLVHLKGLTGLQVIFLSHTKITDAGVDFLRKALPEADITGRRGQPLKYKIRVVGRVVDW